MNPRFESYKQTMEAHYILKRWGTVHTMRDPDNAVTSGNHHVIAAVHHKMLAIMGILSVSDVERAIQFIESTRDVTGVFNRAATKLEHQAHDDIMAICATDFYLRNDKPIFSPIYSKELYDIGNRWVAGWMKVGPFKIPMAFKWYFDNTEETPEIEIKNWFGRFFWLPGFIAECRNDTRYRMNWWHKLNYAIYLLTNAWFEKDKTNISGRQLRWLTIDIIYRRGYWLPNWAIRQWRKSIEKTYGPPLPTTLSCWNYAMSFFHQRSGGADHPFSVYGNDVWALECKGKS